MRDHSPTTYSAQDLTWTDASLWDQFEALAASDPQALAVVGSDGRRWNRAEMQRMALSVRSALLDAQVEPHDRIMLQGRKTAQTLAAALGISAVAGIICPYTPDLGSAERAVLDQRLNHVDRKSVV